MLYQKMIPSLMQTGDIVYCKTWSTYSTLLPTVCQTVVYGWLAFIQMGLGYTVSKPLCIKPIEDKGGAFLNTERNDICMDGLVPVCVNHRVEVCLSHETLFCGCPGAVLNYRLTCLSSYIHKISVFLFIILNLIFPLIMLTPCVKFNHMNISWLSKVGAV